MPGFKVTTIPVTPFSQNCVLLVETDSNRALVVDPGGDVPAILDAIAKSGATVEKIIITHGHLDHVGGGAELKAALQKGGAAVPVIGPDRRDAQLMSQVEKSAASMGLSGMHSLVPDQWLTEGDTVELGALRFDVLFCPGHSPGHVVFIEKPSRFAIVGDVLFRGSVGRTDLPQGDHAALIHNIRTKLLPLGDDFTFVCGHGPGSSFGVERRTNPFLQG